MKIKKKMIVVWLMSVLLFFSYNCISEDVEDIITQGVSFELIGVYENNYGGFEILGHSLWKNSSIVYFNNDNNIVILRTAPKNDNSALTFSKIVYTEKSNNTLYYCTVDYGKSTLEEARNTSKIANSSSPETSGCDSVNNFAWTKLTQVANTFELEDTYESNYGGYEIINTSTWNGVDIYKYDNQNNYVITKNAWNATSNPSKYNKIVYTTYNSSLYYCIVDFGKDTLLDAENTSKTADSSTPNLNGCDTVNNFAWTKLTSQSVDVEVTGYYKSSIDKNNIINNSYWNGVAIYKYNNEENYVITKNAWNATSNPSKYNKIVYTNMSSSQDFYFCEIASGKNTLDDAVNDSTQADSNDLSSGCIGSSWTKMTYL